MSVFSDTLAGLLDDSGVQCAENTVDSCELYFRRLIEANRTTNLTRITSEEDAANMHFFGAIELLKYIELPQCAQVIDIGTGAGFPGIPLKLARPDIALTLLDSAGKKTAFVRDTAAELGIDATVLHARAEESAHTDLRERFDLCVSRAVAALPVLAELCLPFVKVGGAFAAWKGEKHAEELRDAGRAIIVLGGKVSSLQPAGQGAIIVVQKKKPAPDIYPRRFSKIKAKPL